MFTRQPVVYSLKSHSASFFTALALWLILFFTSSPSSAKLLS